MLDLQPYSVLLLIFVVLALKHVSSAVGKSNIEEFAWLGYLRLGAQFGLSGSFKKLHSVKTELASVNREKRSVSAQDEYAKWTKLNRKADKLAADVEKLETEISADKQKIAKAVRMALLLATTAPVWFSRVWFRKVVLFYLPSGVFPRAVEWVLALPFFKTGTVGLTMWMMCANSFLASISTIVGFVLEKEPERPTNIQSESKHKSEQLKS